MRQPFLKWFSKTTSSHTAEKRLRIFVSHKKDGEEFKCQIVNKNMFF